MLPGQVAFTVFGAGVWRSSQLAPPSVVVTTPPSLLTAVACWGSTYDTAMYACPVGSSAEPTLGSRVGSGLACRVQVVPPSVVRKMLWYAPTAIPFWGSGNETPNRNELNGW
jgi:hypothetical protein